MPKIVYHDSEGVEKTVELGLEPVFIGRANECRIQTQDALVSRRHARITVQDGMYWIEDLGSSNGVFLGTQRVQRAQLRPGDQVMCGSLSLCFVADVAAAIRRTQGMAAMSDATPVEPLPSRTTPTSHGAPPPSPPPQRPPSVVVEPALAAAPLPEPQITRAHPLPASVAASDDSEMEVIRLRRRVAQLEADLVRVRAAEPVQEGPDPAVAARMAELEEKARRLEQERDEAVRREKAAARPSPGDLELTLRRVEKERDALQALCARNAAAQQKPPARVAECLMTIRDSLSDMRGAIRAAGDDLTLEQLEQARTLMREVLGLLSISG